MLNNIPSYELVQKLLDLPIKKALSAMASEDDIEGNNPFVEYQSELEGVSLVADDADDLGKQDVKNVIVLYSAMNSLSDSQATDERLWEGLCHGDFWDYLHRRFNVENSGKNMRRT